MRLLGWTACAGAVAAFAFIVAVPEWTVPSASGVQLAPSPRSMVLFPRGQQVEPVPQTPPAPLPAVAEGGPKAGGAYKNVSVLGDVGQAEFMRLQHAMVQWVAPKQGCAFCHAGADAAGDKPGVDWAADDKPQKLAARIMLRMTRQINADWTNHVAPSGVTCFTCHRGQPIPAETWFPQPPPPVRPLVARQDNWQEAADTVRKFFPDAGWAEYYLNDESISAQSLTALPAQQSHEMMAVKRIYEMMMQMSDGMGVNCGFCHNSRALFDWSQSTPQRWTAHYAIGQVRHINNEFLLTLAQTIPMTRTRVHETNLPVLPAQQSGVMAGNGLVVCATCHYAQPKPMGGAAVINDYQALAGPSPEQH